MAFNLPRLVPVEVSGKSKGNFALFTGQLLIAAVIVLGLLVWIWRAHQADVQLASSNAEQVTSLANEIGMRLAPLIRSTEALAASGPYSVAQRQDDSEVLTGALSDADAVRLANLNRTESVLATPLGPELPFATNARVARPGVVPWQITRGLPERWGRRSLAYERRQLARALTRVDPAVVAVAELQADGTTVFLEPYDIQRRQKAWRLLPASMTNGIQQDEARIAAVDLFGADNAGRTVAVLIRVPNHLHNHSVAVFLTMDRLQLPGTPFVLLDRTGQRPLVQSSPGLDWAQWAAGTVQLGRERYAIRFPPIAASAPRGIVPPILVTVALVIVLLLLLSQQVGAIFNVKDRLDHRLAESRTGIEERAQRVAHDLRNVALSLKTLNSNIRSKLITSEVQRFDALITDLDGYSEFLSTRLAAEALGYSEQQILTQTYLRAALEAVANQMRAASSSRLPIRFHESFQGLEPFVSVPGSDLSRILANILRNGVEACEGMADAVIDIEVLPDNDHVRVLISDNGVGIPEDLQRRMFLDGFSTKKGGKNRGKGLSSARERAANHGCTIELVSSAPGAGTTIALQLPVVDTPPWFVNTLDVSNNSVVVIIDDEDIAFDYWHRMLDERFASLNIVGNPRPRLAHLKDPHDLDAQPELLSAATHFLVDYHFDGSPMTGLDVIRTHEIADRAILVTNLFENDSVIKEALKLRVRMLPKVHVLNARLNITLETL